MSKHVDITIFININNVPLQMTTGFLAEGYDNPAELATNIKQRIEESLNFMKYTCMNTAFIVANEIIKQNNLQLPESKAVEV